MLKQRRRDVAHDKQQQLRTFHLFSGAGGGILADLLLGHIPVGACEIEDYPRAVLLQRQRDGLLPEFPIWDDICTLDGRPWRGSVDVLCGGFPCQDISSAGKGAGITGERSGLWKEYLRIIQEVKPRVVFAENSPLLRSRGLVTVLQDLAENGYDARWIVLGSGDLKAPHSRKRMWVLATDTNSNRWKRRWVEKGEVRPPPNGLFEKLAPSPQWGGLSEQCTTPVVCRSRHELANIVDRLKAVGNGQDPRVAALAWRVLTGTKTVMLRDVEAEERKGEK